MFALCGAVSCFAYRPKQFHHMELSVFKEHPGKETAIVKVYFFCGDTLQFLLFLVLINVDPYGAWLSGIYLQRTKCVVSKAGEDIL